MLSCLLLPGLVLPLQDMQPSKLLRLPKQDRAEKLAMLVEGGVEIPASYSTNYLSVLIREAMKEGDDPAPWVDRLNPVKPSDNVEADPYLPSMHRLNLDGMEKARAVTKIVFKDVFLVMLAEGNGGASQLVAFCEALQKAGWTESSSTPTTPEKAILSAAVDEIKAVSQAILTLHTQNCANMSSVTALMASQSGNNYYKHLSRNAVLQNAHWKSLYQGLVSTESVQRHLAPEIDNTQQILDESIEGEKFEELIVKAEFAATKLSHWRNKCPPGRTAAVEASLTKGLKFLVDMMGQKKCPMDVAQQVSGVADLAAKALVTESLTKVGICNDVFQKLVEDGAKAHTELVSSLKTASMTEAFEEFKLTVAEASFDMDSHQERMAVFGKLQQSLQAAHKNNEALPACLSDTATHCLGSGLSALSEALSNASDGGNSQEAVGQLLAEATLLQAILSYLGSPEEAAVQLSAKHVEAARLFCELRDTLTPVTAATSRVALQVSVAMKGLLEIMKSQQAKYKELSVFCTTNFDLVRERGTKVFEETKNALITGGQESLKGSIEALEKVVQKTNWKQRVADDAVWKDVLSAARPVLCNDTLGRELVQALSTVKKEPSRWDGEALCLHKLGASFQEVHVGMSLCLR